MISRAGSSPADPSMRKLIAGGIILVLSACSVRSIDAEFERKMDACDTIGDDQLRFECIKAVEYTDE